MLFVFFRIQITNIPRRTRDSFVRHSLSTQEQQSGSSWAKIPHFSVTVSGHLLPFVLTLSSSPSVGDHCHHSPGIPSFTSSDQHPLASGTVVTLMWKGEETFKSNLIICPMCTHFPTTAASPESVHGAISHILSPWVSLPTSQSLSCSQDDIICSLEYRWSLLRSGSRKPLS